MVYPLFSFLLALYQAPSTTTQNDDTATLFLALAVAVFSVIVIMGIVLAALRPESAE